MIYVFFTLVALFFLYVIWKIVVVNKDDNNSSGSGSGSSGSGSGSSGSGSGSSGSGSGSSNNQTPIE